MKCQYPNCHHLAFRVPVICLPTVHQRADGTWIDTDKPTMMIGENALCEGHIKTYNLSDWMGKGDWEAMQDAARERGYKLADRGAITVQFQPIGWKPGNKFLEIERNNG